MERYASPQFYMYPAFSFHGSQRPWAFNRLSPSSGGAVCTKALSIRGEVSEGREGVQRGHHD